MTAPVLTRSAAAVGAGALLVIYLYAGFALPGGVDVMRQSSGLYDMDGLLVGMNSLCACSIIPIQVIGGSSLIWIKMNKQVPVKIQPKKALEKSELSSEGETP